MECEEFVSQARSTTPDLNIINMAGQFNLREMKELISHYSLFITGDAYRGCETKNKLRKAYL
jgi:hypothetical protein